MKNKSKWDKIVEIEVKSIKFKRHRHMHDRSVSWLDIKTLTKQSCRIKILYGPKPSPY